MAAESPKITPELSPPVGDCWWLGLQAGVVALLFAASWRLWTPQTVYPQIPVVRNLIWPDLVAWGCLGLIGVGLALQLCSPFRPSLARIGSAVGICGLLPLLLEDQHRLQAWVIHLLWIWTIVLTVAAAERRRVLMWLTAAIYVYSAISKLNPMFVEQHGKFLIAGFGMVLSRDPSEVPPIVALGFPITELVIAAGLIWVRTRRIAAALAIGMHLMLIVLFSPMGLSHQWGVMIWNGLFIGQAWTYWYLGRETALPAETSPQKLRWSTILVAIIVVLPALRLAGRLDQWPGWSLYSPRSEVIRVRIGELPAEAASLKDYVYRPISLGMQSDWDGLLLDEQWSLGVLEVPLNPDSRIELGVALGVCERFQLWNHVEIELETRSLFDLRDRRREHIRGEDALRRLAETYQINAFPNRRFRDAGAK